MTLGLVFLFILTVDYPFKGEFSVSNRELAEVDPRTAFIRLNRAPSSACRG